MKFSEIANNAKKLLSSNSPQILTGAAVVGLAATAYLTGRASYHAAHLIRDDEDVSGTADDRKQRIKERTKLVWKLYIPAAGCGVATAACIVGSHKVSSKRTAAAMAAYSISEVAFDEYKKKVVEQIGINKEQKLRDELAEEKLHRTGGNEVVIIEDGKVLCCDQLSGRYFQSSMDQLRRAENTINHKILNERYVTVDEFYDEIGLDHTSMSSDLGWNSDRLMELQITSALTPMGKPCLAFDFNYTKPV